MTWIKFLQLSDLSWISLMIITHKNHFIFKIPITSMNRSWCQLLKKLYKFKELSLTYSHTKMKLQLNSKDLKDLKLISLRCSSFLIIFPRTRKSKNLSSESNMLIFRAFHNSPNSVSLTKKLSVDYLEKFLIVSTLSSKRIKVLNKQ